MAVFKFRLEKILGLRVRAEEQAAQALGRLLSQRLAWLQDLVRMRADKGLLLEIRNELQRGRVEPERLAQNRYQVIVLERAITRLQAELQELDRRVASAQDELAERRRDRKLLDKLEERRRDEFDLEERRREQKESDELPRKHHGTEIALPPTRKHRG